MNELVFCTTVTPGYEHEAEALARNLLETEGSGLHFEAFVVGPRRNDLVDLPGLTWRFAEDLSLNNDELAAVHRALSGFEMACLMKPRALYSVLHHRPGAVGIYLDTDVLALRAFPSALRSLKGVGLSRHTSLLDPAEFPVHAHVGLFNAGVVACSADCLDFTLWWDELCARSASHPAAQPDHDQRFLDWVPAHWPVTDLLAFGINPGPWNVSEFDWSGTGTIAFSGTDLTLFHVSTLRTHVPPETPTQIVEIVERFRRFRPPPGAPSVKPSGLGQLGRALKRSRVRRSRSLPLRSAVLDGVRYSSATVRELFGPPHARWGPPLLYRSINAVRAEQPRSSDCSHLGLP